MRLLLAYALVLGYIRRLWVTKSEVNRVFIQLVRLDFLGLDCLLNFWGPNVWTETFDCQYESVDYL